MNQTNLPVTGAGGRVCLVTGGSSGIGMKLAEHYAAEGYRVMIVARGLERLKQVASSIPGSYYIQADLSSPESRDELASRLASEKNVQLVINCAGRPFRAPATDFDEDDATEAVQLLYISMLAVTGAVWESLKRSGGTVVNVISVEGSSTFTSKPSYNAAKHAALSWSRCLSREARKSGVRVLTVSPGATVTDTFPNTAMQSSRWKRRLLMSDAECASKIIKAVDNGSTESFQPQWWRLLAIVEAIAPGAFTRR